VSRAVAGAPGREDEALRATLKVHLPLAAFVAAALAASAPLYASFERADDVVVPLLVLAGVALLYGLYAPLIGYLNGRGRFGRQAGLDVTFGTLRTLGLVGGGYLFVSRGHSGVLGTTLGWLAAAACIVPLAARSTGLGVPVSSPRPASVPGALPYLGMLLPIAGAQLFTNLLMQADTLLLGRFLSDSAAAVTSGASESAVASREAVKAWIGVYRQCQTFAFLPYQLLFSITLVLFPMLARARAEKDEVSVKAYVLRGSRLAAVFGGLFVAVIVALPEALLVFGYGAAAAKGAAVLRIMVLSQGAFAMLGIATTVLTSLGHERHAAGVTLTALLTVALSCFEMVPGAAFGHAQLVRSSEATGLGLLLALAAATVMVLRRAGAFVPVLTAVRVGLALATCYALGFVVPHVPRLAAPALAIVVAFVYVAVLVVTGELGRSDLAMVRSLRKRGGS
jgi:stage V sporulation protein B